jgi:hypothetical protein
MPPEEQRQFARVWVTAFLDASLKGERRYLPMLRDHRVAGAWLPKTMYVTRWEESSFHPLATYQEDVDVTSGTARGVALAGDSLAVWKEAALKLRSRNGLQENNAVWLGWNNHVAGDDTARMGRPAAYAITLPDTLAARWGLDGQSTLELALAATDDSPKPRQPEKRDSAASDTAHRTRRPAPRPQPKPKAGDAPKPPVDLSVEVADADGHVARLPLSRFGPIRRPLQTYVLRRRGRESDAFPTQYEIVLQGYSILLRDFAQAAPGLDLRRLRTVRLVFDRTPAGTVVLDDVGFARPSADFTRVGAGEAEPTAR